MQLTRRLSPNAQRRSVLICLFIGAYRKVEALQKKKKISLLSFQAQLLFRGVFRICLQRTAADVAAVLCILMSLSRLQQRCSAIEEVKPESVDCLYRSRRSSAAARLLAFPRPSMGSPLCHHRLIQSKAQSPSLCFTGTAFFHAAGSNGGHPSPHSTHSVRAATGCKDQASTSDCSEPTAFSHARGKLNNTHSTCFIIISLGNWRAWRSSKWGGGCLGYSKGRGR